MSEKLREAPKKIYLQWYPREYDSEDCSWCSDKIDENDIEYIRADIEPKHETVEQWEKRTGETYPDDAPVWVIAWIEFSKNKAVRDDKKVCLDTYGDAKKFYNPSKKIYVANHHGKPEDK